MAAEPSMTARRRAHCELPPALALLLRDLEVALPPALVEEEHRPLERRVVALRPDGVRLRLLAPVQGQLELRVAQQAGLALPGIGRRLRDPQVDLRRAGLLVDPLDQARSRSASGSRARCR